MFHVFQREAEKHVFSNLVLARGGKKTYCYLTGAPWNSEKVKMKKLFAAPQEEEVIC